MPWETRRTIMNNSRIKTQAAFCFSFLSFLLLTLPLSATGTFTLAVEPSSLRIPQNGQAMLLVTTTISGGFNSSISLSASGQPLGVSVTFNPSSIGAPGSGTSVMTITDKNIAPTGTYPITVTGNGGGIKQTATVTLTITPTGKGSFTVSAVPSTLTVAQGQQGVSNIFVVLGSGFSGTVSLSASGMPTGTTVNFSPSTIPLPGDGISTMTITVGGSTPTGTYPITVTGTGGGIQQNTTVTLIVAAGPNLTLSASPSSRTVQQGNQGTSTITATTSGGFNSSIALSYSGAPSGTTVSFNPNPIPAPGSGNSTMTITVGSGTPTGTYPITVTGNGGGIQQNTTVTLTVVAPPNFTISASPSSLTIKQGNQGTSTITTSITGGFNSSINLSSSGAPSGTTVSFNPNPIAAPGSGSSTMTITVGSTTPTGTYPITVTGNGGGIQHNATVTLTVTSGGQGTFTISASPSQVTVAQGSRGISIITTTISNGFNSSIGLSASGVPSGTHVTFVPFVVNAPGAGSSTMYMTVGSGTPVGAYPITVTGTGGGTQQNTTVTLTVVAPGNFTISASPSSVTIQQGNQGGSTITTTISGGFNSSISLAASGMPTGTTVTFDPPTIPPPGNGNSAMTITVASNTPSGTYPITVTGNGGGIQQNTTVTLTVTAGSPNFTISASPSSLSIQPGNQGSSTITTTISGGFNSSITLSASGQPSGTTVIFNPQTIPSPGNGNSTMTITVGSTTPTGTYPITVTGNGGGIQQNTTVTLTVTTQQQSAPPNGMIGYALNSTNIPPGILAPFEAWLYANFQMVIGTGGLDLTPYRGSGNEWPTYVDGCCIYGWQLYQSVLSTAASYGWPDPEGPLLHMNIDYQPNPIYSAIDQFDAYEQSSAASGTQGLPTAAVNGIFNLVGSTYTDITVQAYCPTSGVPTDYWGTCANYPASPFTVSDRLLIGYQIPFDTVNITLHTPRSGGTVTWQYWNGLSFSKLPLASDTTGGLTTTGTVTFLPPSNWIPSGIHGSQSKYWVQITVSGAGPNPSISKVYGDNLLSACTWGQCARGWNASACVAGHINIGTPVEYCGTPHSGSTAKFRQQARALGYRGAYNDFYANPINIQNGQNTWADVEMARTAAALGFSGMNGVMFDDGGCAPQLANPTWSNTQTELGETTYSSAATTLFTAEHTLLTVTYGSNPRWWDGLNACGAGSLITSMNWELSDQGNQVVNSLDMDTHTTEYLCTDPLWCPGQSTSNNPNGTVQYMQTQDYTQFGLQDGNGNSLSDFHLWDMSQRGPMNTLAMFYMVKNPNLLFGYNPAGVYYDGFDDYYYWVKSTRTVGSPGITASTCAKGCSIPLSSDLGVSCPASGSLLGCPIRLGGVDVVGTTSYSGTTLTTQTSIPDAILHNYSPGASIEYVVEGHQSVDSPLHTPVFMYGTFIPASAIYLGTPDSTYGFNTPCTSSSYWVDGGCIWMHGLAISGNASACDATGGGSGFPLDKWCSPLLRRDFAGGPHGGVIVLLRPITSRDNPTATTEYDTPSQTITLPGTYYQVMADGTVSSTPITTTKLRGGEAGIYVTRGQ